MDIITVKQLCKTYHMKGYDNEVLRNIDFTMEDGEFVSIMGPSGSGKSTLLYSVSGMDNIDSGSVVFNGREISSLKRKELSSVRLTEMGFIFQQMYMLKKLCVFDNIVLPAYQAGQNRDEANSRASELMYSLGISDISLREVSEVSGGQLQRACICRALINEPKVIFADEPTGALNSRSANEVMQELRKINHTGTGIMMVTHSVKVAAQSDRVIYLVDGTIQGDVHLGRLENENDLPMRDHWLNKWLMDQGW